MSIVDQLERMLKETQPKDVSWQRMQQEYDDLLSKGIIKKQEYDLAPLQVSAPSGLVELQSMLYR